MPNRSFLSPGHLLLALAVALAGCANAPPQTRHPQQDAIRFVAQNPLATANGIFHDWRIVEWKLDEDDPSASTLEIEIDVASIETGMDGRDEHMREPDYFDAERWPHARVRVTEVAAAEGEPDRFRTEFEVEIRDQKRAVPGSFAVVSRTPLVVEGEATLDRTEFGVGPPTSSWNPTIPEALVEIQFRITLGEGIAQRR